MTDDFERRHHRPWRRILPAAIAVILLLAALPLAVMLDQRDLTAELSRLQAADTSRIIDDVRRLYADEVVNKILQAPSGTTITATDKFHDVPGAVPISATFSMEIGRLTSARTTGSATSSFPIIPSSATSGTNSTPSGPTRSPLSAPIRS